MFRLVGDDRYTCVAPPGYEKDPAVLAAIREFDEGAMPIWRLQMWLYPGELTPRVVIHHGIGRYFPAPRYLRRHFHVDMPADSVGPAPNFLDRIFEDDESLTYKQGGPGGYIPWDWSTYYWCRSRYETITLAAWEARHEGRKDWIRKAHEDWKKELDYRRRDVERRVMRRLEALTDADWEAWLELTSHSTDPQVLRAREEIKRQQQKNRVSVASSGRSPRTGPTDGRVAPDQGV